MHHKKTQPKDLGWVFTSEDIKETLDILLELKHAINARSNFKIAHAHATLLIEAVAAQKVLVPGERLQPIVKLFFEELLNQL